MTTNIKDYNTTQADNTTLNTINVAEGMLPSSLNNAIRALMKNTRDWFNDSQWVEYGDGSGAATYAYVSATSFTVAGSDVTSQYHTGRRIKITAPTPGTIYGTIASSSFSTNTTVNVTWDSGSLSSEALTNVYIGAISKNNNSLPTGISATNIADGTVSDTEFQYINTLSSNAQTQLDAKASTITGAASTIVSSDLTASRAIQSNGSGKVEVSSVTSTELGYVSGVTSAIQTQFSGKQATITGGATTITSSDLTASKALASDASGKVAVTSVTDTELGYVSGVTSAIQTQLDAKQPLDAQLTDIAGLTPTDSNFIVGDGSNFTTETGATARTSLGLGSVATQAANSIAITGGSITGMVAPSAGSDVANKTYVDELVAGLKTRIICRSATTANISLATDLQNGDTLDGVTLATDDRVLVKNQTTNTENGIYVVVASGTASRDPDFDTVAELAGQLTIIKEGTTNADTLWLCTTDSGTIGSATITFTQIFPSSGGTVTSVAVADAGASEFTITGSPITGSGTINLAIDSIGAAKIANGTVSDTEFQYINSLSSNAQDQLDTKASAGFSIAMSVAL
jgi:hypothetical protein